MTTKEKLKKHLTSQGKDRSWVELADLYRIKIGASNKQKSDYVRKLSKSFYAEPSLQMPSAEHHLFQEFIKWKNNQKTYSRRPHLPVPYGDGDKKNVLVIGDLHEPFCLNDYLDFCRFQQERFNCGTIVFIGDVIDNNYSSYHDSDPDGLSAGYELNYAIERVQDWYKVFPEAIVTIGNHDRLAYRKAFSGALSKKWVRSLNEVLQVPNWHFYEEIEIDGVVYSHGEGGTARNKMKHHMQSTVQGHFHTQSYVDYIAGRKEQLFAVQVGCGVDAESYALAYAKKGPNQIIGCAVILDGGKLPIIINK